MAEAVVKLILEEGGKTQPFEFGDDTISIGRTADNSIKISDALSSRHHCHVRRDGDGFVVEDLKSRNGTRLNGAPLTDAKALTAGDRIEVGDSVIHFEKRKQATKRRSRRASSAKRAPAKSSTPHSLRVLEGDTQGEAYPLEQLPFVCGRKKGVSLALTDNDVSNEHCMIVEDDGVLHVVDLGSTNGTFLDGARIKGRAPLLENSTIRLGATLTFRLEGGGGAAPARQSARTPKKSKSKRAKRPKKAAAPAEVEEVASLDALGEDEETHVDRARPAPAQRAPEPTPKDLTSASAVVEQEGDVTKIEFGTGLEVEAVRQLERGGGGTAGVVAVVGALLLVVGSVAFTTYKTFLVQTVGDPSPANNKLDNWSFEVMSKGRFAGWELVADEATVATDDVRHGERALALAVAPNTRPEFYSSAYARVAGGKSYRVRATVALGAGTAAALRVDWQNDDGTFVRSTFAHVTAPATSARGWKDISGVLSAPASATQARVAGVAIAAPSGGTVRFDRVSLSEVSEADDAKATLDVTGPAGLLVTLEPSGQLRISREETQLVRRLAYDVGLIGNPDDPLTGQGAARVLQPLSVQTDESLLSVGSLANLDGGEPAQYTFTARVGADGIRLRWLLAPTESEHPILIRFRVPKTDALAPLELDGTDVGTAPLPKEGLLSKDVREMSWGSAKSQVSFHLSAPARVTLRAAGTETEMLFAMRPRRLANGLLEVGFDIQAASLRTRESIRRLLSQGEAARKSGEYAAAAAAYRRLIREFGHDEAVVAQAKRELAGLSARADRMVDSVKWARTRASAMPVPPLLDAAQATVDDLTRGFPDSRQVKRARRELAEVRRAVAESQLRADGERVRELVDRAKKVRAAGHVRLARLLYTYVLEHFDGKVRGVQEAKERLAALPPLAGAK